MKLLPVSLSLVVVALAFGAPAGQAKLVVQQSLAGVKLGMTATQVRGVLGDPRSVSYPSDQIQGSVKHMDYGLTDVWLNRGAEGTVYMVTTTSRKQRTDAGIGVGSTRAAVMKSVAHVKCNSQSCFVGPLNPGVKVTAFLLSAAGKVRSITLGYVED
jgi:hypothetical protein